MMGPSSAALSSARSKLWSDAALAQLAQLAGASPMQHSGELAANAGEAVADSALAQQAAAELLVVVLTQPGQGLVGEALPLDVPLVSTAADTARQLGSAVPATAAADHGNGEGWASSGVKRVLRLLARMRPTEQPLHAVIMQVVPAVLVLQRCSAK